MYLNLVGQTVQMKPSSILHASRSLQLAALWGDILRRKDKVYTEWWVLCVTVPTWCISTCTTCLLLHKKVSENSSECHPWTRWVWKTSSLSQELLSSLSCWATERVEQFTPQQLAGLVWSCAKMLEGEKPLLGMVKWWWNLGFLLETMVVGLKKATAREEDSAALSRKHCDQVNPSIVGGL